MSRSSSYNNLSDSCRTYVVAADDKVCRGQGPKLTRLGIVYGLKVEVCAIQAWKLRYYIQFRLTFATGGRSLLLRNFAPGVASVDWQT